MKAIPFILIISVNIISGCSDDDPAISTGDKIHTLRKVFENEEVIETFYYNQNDQLVEIIKNTSDGDIYQIRYIFDYEAEQLVRIQKFNSNNILIAIDSIFYNDQDDIKKIFNFYKVDDKMRLIFLNYFNYDSIGRVSEKKIYSNPSDNNLLEKYLYFYDENDNIDRVEVHGDSLLYEFFYTYDQYNNYKKQIPYHIDDPLTWGKHNIIKESWIDYTRVFDQMCNGCEQVYNYNSENYPIYNGFSIFSQTYITYK